MNKAHIIEEIRRTAAANGGVPLGRQRFATATGIQEHHWAGKYWARWGDALQEVGFAPNQLNRAYDKAYIFDRYAGLAKELGRLPTANELRLRHRLDSKSPDQKVFERFGTKTQLVKQVLDFCRDHGGYDEVTRLCEAYNPPSQAVLQGARQENEIGFVYLIKSGRFFKIGRSNSSGRRSYELDIQLPERAKPVHEIRTDDPNGIEA